MWAWAKYRHCLAAFDTCEGKKLTELSQMQEMEHLEERQRKILCLSSLLLHLDGLAGYPAQWIGCLPEHEKAWMCSVRRGIDWKCTKTFCLLVRRHNVLGWIQAVGEGHPASAGWPSHAVPTFAFQDRRLKNAKLATGQVCSARLR